MKIWCISTVFWISTLLQAQDAGNKANHLKATMNFFLDNAVLLSIVFIFVSALIGFFVKQRAVDKCLKDFESDLTVIETTDGSNIEGKLHLYSTGMEMEYEKVWEKSGSARHTHIMFKEEYGNLHMVCRYQDALSKENARSRERDIKKTYKPSMWRRFKRSVRNILGTFRDAFVKAFGVLMGQAKRVNPGLKGQEKELKSIGSDLIGHSGNTFDPILEKYIGRLVVLEVKKGEEREYYQGIFKEYSPEFLEVLNTPRILTFDYDLSQEEKALEGPNYLKLPLEVKKVDGGLEIKNVRRYPIQLETITCGEKEESIQRKLASEEVWKFEGDVPEQVKLKIVRLGDIIVPRSHAMIRHAADNRKMDWKSIIQFDLTNLY